VEVLGASKVEFLGLIFLCFFFDSVLLVAALAGVSIGTTASAVEKIASVKSRIANLLMRLSGCGWGNPGPL
jgi:arginine exporter protein ArgO